MKKFKWVVFAVAFMTLAWALLFPQPELALRLTLAAKMIAFLGSIYGFLVWKRQFKESGLTKDEFQIKQAGGMQNLPKQIRFLKIFAIIFTIIPFAASLAIFILSPASPTKIFYAFLILGLPFFTLSIALFHQSRKFKGIIRISQLTKL